MELPPALREAVDTALEGVPARDLAAASNALSERYRAELRDGRAHVADDRAARAYLAALLPSTCSSLRAALEVIPDLLPEFSPRTLLDFGAGPGTARWAKQDRWPYQKAATLVEGSTAMRKY